MNIFISKQRFKPRYCAVILAMAFCFAGPAAVGKALAQSAKSASFADDEIRKGLAGRKNVSNYIRVSGMMSDILRVQKQLFVKANGDKVNKPSMDAEELMNSSAMYAATHDYDNGYKELETAYAIISKSLTDLGRGK